MLSWLFLITEMQDEGEGSARRHLFSFKGALQGRGSCGGRTGSQKSAAGVCKSASAIAALHTGASQAIWAAGGR